MKKSLVIMVMVFLASLSIQAQEKPATPQDSIVFENTIHDYGTINQSSDGTCEFKFTNKGKSPILLSNVHASCGCTVPEWPKEPILPGKTNSIKVKYNTANVGSFGKTITVSSNAVNSSVILTIKGNVIAKQ